MNFTEEIENLLNTLNSTEGNERMTALEQMSQLAKIPIWQPILKELAFAPIVERLLTDEDSDVRFTAMETLEALKDSRAIFPLMKQFTSEDWVLGEKAAQIIGKNFNDAAFPYICEMFLNHPMGDSQGYACCADVFMYSKDPDVVDFLINALKHENTDIRAHSAITLSRFCRRGTRMPIQPLIKLLNDPILRVRISAAASLRVCDKKGESLPILRSILAKGDQSETNNFAPFITTSFEESIRKTIEDIEKLSGS